jgi:glycosyltransferase 2 family protein
MTDVALAAPPAADPPRRRALRMAAWIVGTLAVLVALRLAGIDVWGWFQQLWDTLTEISIGYLIVGCFFQGLQTCLTALGWYGILRYAYPGGVTYMPVLAAYATGVALNNFVPANMGTFVTLLMYVAIVRGATFPGVLGGYVVQKIFYLVIGTFIYLYLFWAVSGSFDYQFGDEWDSVSGHPVLVIGLAAGAVFLGAVLVRIFWRWVKGFWLKAKEGGAILGEPGKYVKWVLLPQMGGYAAKVIVVAIFLAAYSIPVTFGSIMSVLGSNQLANILSFTPGGIGVNQAFNSFALESYTTTTTATAYSLGQQLITTAFNAGFAIVLICMVFGWQGGSKLVKDSYGDAKVKKEEMSADRHAKREAKREAKRAEARGGLMRVFRRGDETDGT